MSTSKNKGLDRDRKSSSIINAGAQSLQGTKKAGGHRRNNTMAGTVPASNFPTDREIEDFQS